MMIRFTDTIRRFCVSTAGATLVEYGVALLVVIIVGATAITGLGDAVGSALSDTTSAF
jgi:Flp pilus assembly pilin Flp